MQMLYIANSVLLPKVSYLLFGNNAACAADEQVNVIQAARFAEFLNIQIFQRRTFAPIQPPQTPNKIAEQTLAVLLGNLSRKSQCDEIIISCEVILYKPLEQLSRIPVIHRFDFRQSCAFSLLPCSPCGSLLLLRIHKQFHGFENTFRAL